MELNPVQQQKWGSMILIRVSMKLYRARITVTIQAVHFRSFAWVAVVSIYSPPSLPLRSIKNDGNNEYLTVHNSMYIAGLPEETGEKALKLWHLRNATSFNGKLCSSTLDVRLAKDIREFLISTTFFSEHNNNFDFSWDIRYKKKNFFLQRPN